MTTFRNTSTFQGVKEFTTDIGEQVRAIDEGASWGIYVLDSEGNTYVRHATVIKRNSDTPRKIWTRVIDESEWEGV